MAGPAEAQGFVSGGAQRLGGKGRDGLPSPHEDEIHGGGGSSRHVSQHTDPSWPLWPTTALEKLGCLREPFPHAWL